MIRRPKKVKLFGKPRKSVVKHPGSFRAAAKRRGMTTEKLFQTILANPDKYDEKLIAKAKLAKAFHTMRAEKRGRTR